MAGAVITKIKVLLMKRRAAPDVATPLDAGGDGKKRRRVGVGSEAGGGTTSPLLMKSLLALARETRGHLRFHEQFPEAPPVANGDGEDSVPSAASASGLGVDTCCVYGIDCEAVVTSDRRRALARVSIVEATWPLGLVGSQPNAIAITTPQGVAFRTVLDVFIDPLSGSPKGATITDFKTQFSGISADLLADKRACEELYDTNTVLERVGELLRDPLSRGALSFVVGHAVHNDLNMLALQGDVGKVFEVIDTACLYGYESLPLKSMGLKSLMKMVLGCEVQSDSGGHSSVEDSKSALALVAHEVRLLATSQARTRPFPISAAPWSKSLQVFNVRKEDEGRFVQMMKGALQRQERLRVARRNIVNSHGAAAAPEEEGEILYERASSTSSSSSSSNVITKGAGSPPMSSGACSDFELEELAPLSFRDRERGGPIGSMRLHFHTVERARSFWIDLASRMPATSYMLDGEGFWQKKVVMVQGCSAESGKRHPCSFYIKMFADRVPFTPEEQSLRTAARRAPPPKSIKTKHPDRALGVCIACGQSLANYWIRPVLPTGSLPPPQQQGQQQQQAATCRYVHSSATHCARVVFGFGSRTPRKVSRSRGGGEGGGRRVGDHRGYSH